MANLHQLRTWKSWYETEGYFQGDSRAVAFGLCVDGVNPFAKERTKYSMWPIVLSALNLPSHIRIMAGSMMLVGIIPGRAEPKNTDAYLNVLVDDILEVKDLTFHDDFQSEKFHPRADILIHTLDYPRQNKVFHCQGE